MPERGHIPDMSTQPLQGHAVNVPTGTPYPGQWTTRCLHKGLVNVPSGVRISRHDSHGPDSRTKSRYVAARVPGTTQSGFNERRRPGCSIHSFNYLLACYQGRGMFHCQSVLTWTISLPRLQMHNSLQLKLKLFLDSIGKAATWEGPPPNTYWHQGQGGNIAGASTRAADTSRPQR